MSEKRTAIVVMHGIGQQEQLATLSQFVDGLSAVDHIERPREFVRREFPDGEDAFSYYVTQPDTPRSKDVIAEFYWADLSKLTSGWFSSLRNFFVLLTDLPDLILASFDGRQVDGRSRDNPIFKFLRMLVSFAMWMIYVPIVSLNVAYATVISVLGVRLNLSQSEMFAALKFNKPNPAPGDGPARFLDRDIDPGIYAVILVAVLGLILVSRVVDRRYVRVISYWSIAWLTLLTAFVYASPNGWLPPPLDLPANTYDDVARAVQKAFAIWTVPIVVLIFYFITLPIWMVLFWKRARSLLLSLFALYVTITFWLLFFVIVWMSVFTQIFEEETYKNLVTSLKDGLQVFSVNIANIALIAMGLGLAFLSHYLRGQRRRSHPDGIRKGHPYPRLILPMGIIVFSIVLTLAWITATAWCDDRGLQLYNETLFKLTNLERPVFIQTYYCENVAMATEVLLLYSVVVLLVIGFIGQTSQLGLDIATDIVNYFKGTRGHRNISPFASVTSVFWPPKPEQFTVREKLRGRLTRVLADLRASDGPFDRTVLVSHSLGTMVAIDYLRRRDPAAEDLGEVVLVTMGSPYRDIFRHYFEHLFPPANEALIPGGVRWINIYRENDYVGTRVSPGDVGIEEVRQPPRGHLGYFNDPDVAKEIVGRALAPQSAGPAEA